MSRVGASRKIEPSKAILTGLMSLLATLQLFPLLWLLNFSLVSNSDLYVSGILVWPKKLLFENYVDAWTKGKIPAFMLHSLIVASATILLTVVLALMLSYAIARMKWKLSKICLTYVLLGIMIPIHATLVPNFIVFQKLHLLNTYAALILPYVAFNMPVAVFVLTGYLKTIPKELEEAAVIDGCGVYRIIFNILLPIMKPAVVTVVIMTFMSCWNEYIMALTYLIGDKLYTLPFSVMLFIGYHSSNYVVQLAVMMLSALPALVMYFLFNEQITKGVTTGAIKG